MDPPLKEHIFEENTFITGTDIIQTIRNLPQIKEAEEELKRREKLNALNNSDEVFEKISSAREIRKKRYDQMLSKITFQDLKYDYESRVLLPCVYFMKYLAKKPEGTPEEIVSKENRLRVWLPDTLIFNDGDLPPMWLYTSEDGYVYRTDNFSFRNIQEQLTVKNNLDELIACVKKPKYNLNQELVGNEVKLLSSKDLSNVSFQLINTKGDFAIIQRFVKPNGPQAYISRTVWRKKKFPYSYTITNKNSFYDESFPDIEKFCTKPGKMNHCSIIYTSQGKAVEETSEYLSNIVKFMKFHVNLRIEKLIGDFIKDEEGTWWLINIKGFAVKKMILAQDMRYLTHYSIEQPLNVMELKNKLMNPDYYQKTVNCKYCDLLYTEDKLTNRMSLKMLIQLDLHLIHRGKDFKYLERSRLKHLDTAMLYQEHKVCLSCFVLYKACENLMEVEYNFAKAVGIPVKKGNKYNKITITSFTTHDLRGNNVPDASSVNKFHNNPKKAKMPENWNLDIETETTMLVLNNLPRNNQQAVISEMRRYRLMVMLHCIRNIPLDIDLSEYYYLEFEVFNQRVRVKFDLMQLMEFNGYFLLPINALRVFYFFCTNQKDISELLKSEKLLKIDLFCQGERFGSIQFDISDTASDNVKKIEIFKNFIGKNIPVMSWVLNIVVGIVEGDMVSVERIELFNEFKGIYYTHPDYYCAEPFPEEWISMIQEKVESNESIQKNRMMISQMGMSSEYGKDQRKYPKKTPGTKFVQFSQRDNAHSFHFLNKAKSIPSSYQEFK